MADINIMANEKIDASKVSEYLNFLLKELTRYKEDWEITEDEFEILKNEFQRFKLLVSSSNKIPMQIKEEVEKLSFNSRDKTKPFKFLRYFFLPNAAYWLNQIEDKNAIDLIEYDIKKILIQLELNR